MRILLDENLPRKLVNALRTEGHQVKSVHTLRMQGLDNGKLYQYAIQNFDVCFTRDFGFANNVRQGKAPAKFKLLRVTLPQKPQDQFVADFISAFRNHHITNVSTATIGLKFRSKANMWFGTVAQEDRPKKGFYLQLA